MGFLDHLLRAMTSRPETTELDESERLRLEVVQLYQAGRFGEAEQSARRLVDLQRELLGPDHPDYATALSNLALVLQQRGDLDTAEPLLRQALKIRRDALGETHPDHASSLNNLALLLCERRDLDAAEPLLQQALEVRRLALGEDHPDYATSLNNLALLLCERHDFDAAEPLLRQALQIRRETLGDQHPDTLSSSESLSMVLVRQGASSPLATAVGDVDSRSDGGTREVNASQPHRVSPAPARLGRRGDPSRPWNAKTFADDLAELTRAFTSASELLLQEAVRMQSSGLPPDLVALSAASSCQHDFVALRHDVLGLAETLLVPPNIPERVASLEDLEDLIETIAKAEAALSQREETRRRALDILEQVLALSSGDPTDLAHLDECRAQARLLHSAISNCRAFELPVEADRLSRRDHPLGRLLSLAHDDGETSGEAWSELYNDVVAAFGQPLAVAAARGRLAPVDDRAEQEGESTSGSMDMATPVEAEAV